MKLVDAVHSPVEKLVTNVWIYDSQHWSALFCFIYRIAEIRWSQQRVQERGEL